MTVFFLCTLYLGIAVTVIGIAGVLRFRDVYARMKALALVNSAGAVLVHLSTAFLLPWGDGNRGVLTALMFFLSGPVVGQVILLAAHREKVPHVNVPDEFEEVEKEKGD